ncbi:MAG: sigma 54-interacting transcriptional regulator [Byssovorax sp.]
MSRPWTGGPLFSPPGIAYAAQLYATCPFAPRWGGLLRFALHDSALPQHDLAWSLGGTPGTKLDLILPGLRQGVTAFAAALAAGTAASPDQIKEYQGAALFLLWEEHAARLQRLIDENLVDVPFYDTFVERHRVLFGHPALTVPGPAHLLALFYQVRRTWHFASTNLLGRSFYTAATRQALWHANLGGDICTYAASLYDRMDDVPVLITGETGTGKELAAQCIAWSRYIPFDPAARRFARRYTDDFHARSLCEVPVDLQPSALFGHKRGSFTGATADVPGYFALPGRHGTLFLDEIGELPEHVQAKLLRPLQNRAYIPLGETEPRPLLGRLVFATNRDIEAMCREGKFRSDLLERMNGVHIHMTSLRQLLAEAPEDLEHFVRAFIAAKIPGSALIDTWTANVLTTIHETRRGYLWPRNLRELRNFTERTMLGFGPVPYEPAPPVEEPDDVPAPQAVRAPPSIALPSTALPSSGLLGPRAKTGEVSAEDLTRSLVKRVHAMSGENIAETARRTRLNWRTVAKLLKRPKSPIRS